MADIILFRGAVHPYYKSPYYVPPWGLLYVASLPYHDTDFTIKIIDEELHKDWQTVMRDELTDKTICVGVSSITGHQIHSGLTFSRFVKNRVDVPVVWGCAHPTILPEGTLEHPLVDIVVKGEGEYVFYNLVCALARGEALSHIDSLGYKDSSRIIMNKECDYLTMNDLPDIPLSLIDVEDYINRVHPACTYTERGFELHISRGCNHGCSFCYNNKGKWRGYSAERVIDQVEKLRAAYHIDGLHWREDNFLWIEKESLTYARL